MALLEIENLHVYYGSVHALKGVSLEVEEGETVAILGANGAGKSTLLRTVSGLLKPREGSIRFEGAELSGKPAHEVVSLGISQSPEGRQVFPTLTVTENLKLGAFVNRAGPERLASLRREMYALFPRLEERQNQLAGTLSGGEQQMLAIARALMSEPRLLLLDEPSLGIAPILVKTIFQKIRDIADQGVTVLVVEQNVRAALRLADRGYVLETGRLVSEGSAEELAADDRVRQAYLGG